MRHSRWILEAWATWETFRRMGFSADDIFWEFAPTLNAVPEPGIALNVVLRTQGKQLAVACSHRLTEKEATDLQSEAHVFRLQLKGDCFKAADMRKWMENSHCWKNLKGLVAAIALKGIEAPKRLN